MLIRLGLHTIDFASAGLLCMNIIANRRVMNNDNLPFSVILILESGTCWKYFKRDLELGIKTVLTSVAIYGL